MCVLLTTTSSFQRGYLTALVDDCCADFRDAHEICLRRFEGFFDTISYKYLEDYQPKWNYQMSQLKYHSKKYTNRKKINNKRKYGIDQKRDKIYFKKNYVKNTHLWEKKKLSKIV